MESRRGRRERRAAGAEEVGRERREEGRAHARVASLAASEPPLAKSRLLPTRAPPP